MLTRESPRHAGGRSIVIALVIAEVISAFEASMIYAALPTLMREFGDPAGVGWVLTAYLLVGSVSAGLASRLGDLFGRRRVVLALLACSASGSLISASSSGLGGLVCGRALQGMSAALLPLAIGIVREHLAAPRVPVAVGWLTATATFSAGAGLLLGGLLGGPCRLAHDVLVRRRAWRRRHRRRRALGSRLAAPGRGRRHRLDRRHALRAGHRGAAVVASRA